MDNMKNKIIFMNTRLHCNDTRNQWLKDVPAIKSRIVTYDIKLNLKGNYDSKKVSGCIENKN